MNSQFVPFSQEIRCRRFHIPGAGVQGFSSWKLIGFSILKAQEKPLLEGIKMGGVKLKFTWNYAMNCQFVLFSSEIPLWHRGSRGRSPRKLMGFSVLKAQENPFQRVKINIKSTQFCNEFLICTISTRRSMLPPILNSPEWLSSPD